MEQAIFSNKSKYPNLSILFSILFFTYIFYREGLLAQYVGGLADFGFISIFLVGMFFISTFTVVPATAILFLLEKSFGIPTVALIAGLGAMFGDYFIFRFVKEDLVEELKDIFNEVAGDFFMRFHWMAHTKYFLWFGPVLGALVIASPLPDELGIGLLGIYKLDNKRFMLLSYILNTVGIFLLLSAVEAVN